MNNTNKKILFLHNIPSRAGSRKLAKHVNEIHSLTNGGDSYSKKKKMQNKGMETDFPGGPVVKTLLTMSGGPGFNPWLGN